MRDEWKDMEKRVKIDKRLDTAMAFLEDTPFNEKTEVVVDKLKRLRNYLLREFPLPELTEVKRRQANKLYDAAVYFRKVQMQFLDGVTHHSLDKLQKAGEELDAIVTEINGGKDPVDFESKTAGIFATAAMLAGGAR